MDLLDSRTPAVPLWIRRRRRGELLPTGAFSEYSILTPNSRIAMEEREEEEYMKLWERIFGTFEETEIA